MLQLYLEQSVGEGKPVSFYVMIPLGDEGAGIDPQRITFRTKGGAIGSGKAAVASGTSAAHPGMPSPQNFSDQESWCMSTRTDTLAASHILTMSYLLI